MSTDRDIIDVPLENATRFLNFGAVTLISTTDGVTPDVSTVAWAKPCAKKPPTFTLTVGVRHRTYANLLKTGILGINVPTADQVGTVMYCGHHSGNDSDKIREGGVAVRLGKVLPTLPLVDGCAAWLECRVDLDSLEEGSSLVRVEAVGASCVRGVMTDQYTWDTEKFPTLHHLGGSRFIVGGEIIDHPDASSL